MRSPFLKENTLCLDISVQNYSAVCLYFFPKFKGNGLNCLQCDSWDDINCIIQPEKIKIEKFNTTCSDIEADICRTIVVNWSHQKRNLRIVRQCGTKGDELSNHDDDSMSVHSTDYNIFDCEGEGCNHGNTSEKIKYSFLIVAFFNILVMLMH